MRRPAAALFLVLVAACAHAPPLTRATRQLVVVTAPDAGGIHGTLRRYERADGGWREVGEGFPVVLGRTGLATRKRERDGKSPAGVWPFGRAFGYDAEPVTLMPFLPLTPATECVDDTASRFYNAIVEREAVSVDWNSSEKMRSVTQYRRGIVVLYNEARRKGKGSCIFLHIWGGPDKPTAGCTAMDAKNLEELLAWLNPAMTPRIVQLTDADYARRRAEWDLP